MVSVKYASILVCAYIAVSLLTVATAEDDPNSAVPGVLDLDPDNFDQHVNGRKHVLLELYAPWCGHCKRMVPELKKLGAAIAADPKLSSRTLVAKVDADKHRSLGERFGVKGFPTVLHLARGQPVDKPNTYQGARTHAGFLSFLQQQLENDKGFARSDALDAFASKFLEAAEDGRAAVVDETKKAVAALQGDGKAAGDLYDRYMAKGIAKGNDYFQTEYDRLERLMNSAASPARLAEIARRSSVLSAFIPALNTKEAKAATADANDMQEDDMESGDAFESPDNEEEDVEVVDDATAEALAAAAAKE